MVLQILGHRKASAARSSWTKTCFDIPDSTNAYSFFHSLSVDIAEGCFSLCTPLWLVSSEALGNLLSQPIQGQKNGLSLVWIRLWRVKLPCVLQALLHLLQEQERSLPLFRNRSRRMIPASRPKDNDVIVRLCKKSSNPPRMILVNSGRVGRWLRPRIDSFCSWSVM